MNLNNRIKQTIDLLNLELHKNLTEMKGSLLEECKQSFVIDWNTDEIYFDKSNIIFTEINDYNRFKEFNPKLNDILKVEISDFNTYIYVCTYVNCPTLNEIIHQGSEE